MSVCLCVCLCVCIHRVVELEVVIPEAEPICIEVVLLRHILERLACKKKIIRLVRTECANVRDSVCMRERVCVKECAQKRVYARESMCARVCRLISGGSGTLTDTLPHVSRTHVFLVNVCMCEREIVCESEYVCACPRECVSSCVRVIQRVCVVCVCTNSARI